KAGHTRGAQELFDAVGREHDVDVLSHTADVSMTPHRPPAAHDRFASEHFKQMIQRAHDLPITAGKILRFQHVLPARQKFICQFQLLSQTLKGYTHRRFGATLYEYISALMKSERTRALRLAPFCLRGRVWSGKPEPYPT